MKNKVQKFNIVCVTQHNMPGRRETAHWHLPITGSAEVCAVIDEDEMGVNVGRTIVSFQGKDYPLIKTRSGLNGLTVVLCIDVEILGWENVKWELYTDTFAPEKKATPNELQEIIKCAIRSGKFSRGLI